MQGFDLHIQQLPRGPSEGGHFRGSRAGERSLLMESMALGFEEGRSPTMGSEGTEARAAGQVRLNHTEDRRKGLPG